jgi:hypothetical protein
MFLGLNRFGYRRTHSVEFFFITEICSQRRSFFVAHTNNNVALVLKSQDHFNNMYAMAQHRILLNGSLC